MAGGVRVVIDDDAVNAFLRDPATRAMVQEYGDRLAASARAHAARRTGAGAASITATMIDDGPAVEADVQWDAAHHYMFFQEFGTSKMAAHPALGPALDEFA